MKPLSFQTEPREVNSRDEKKKRTHHVRNNRYFNLNLKCPPTFTRAPLFSTQETTYFYIRDGRESKSPVFPPVIGVT